MINTGIVDYGVAKGDVSYIVRSGIIMVALSFVQFACAIGASILGTRVALKAGKDLREKIYVKILSLSQKEIAVMGAPTLITRATNDVQQVIQFVLFLFTSIINAPIMFVGGVALSLMQDVKLSIVIIVIVPILIVISIIFISKMVPYYRKNQKGIDALNSVIRDQISGVRVVKAFGNEKYEENRLEDVNENLYQINLAIGRMTTLLTPLFTFIVGFSKLAIMYLGGRFAVDGVVEIGKISAFMSYTSFILSATLIASMVFLMLPKADVSAERIMEIFDTYSTVKDKDNSKTSIKRGGELVFKNVEYSYAPDNPEVEPVLKNISFSAKPGQTTAIIGSTGCGKSTLLNLIPRLADATKGQILYDGVDIKDYDRNKLDDIIGLVPQKSFLFGGTLAQNLRYANKNATDDELWEALRIAQADGFIKESKGQLNMQVSEGGKNYSGGQRQRLAIARAIVRHPAIYIFDDSFSALDYATDKKLRSALKEVTQDSVVIIVGQRISSIRNADQIIVLNNGEIEAIGTHEELLASCRTYQEIADSQPSQSKEVGA
jgi:ATP-binding cassette subfamily B protein